PRGLSRSRSPRERSETRGKIPDLASLIRATPALIHWRLSASGRETRCAPPLVAGQSHVASFRRTGATSESKSGRARNFGIQPRSRTHDSNPKFPHAIALPQGGGYHLDCSTARFHSKQ